jgi:hypothetical protein
MDKFKSGNTAPQCNATTPLNGETAEILLRYASFATAGLPPREVDRALALLARQRDNSEPIAGE